MEEQNKQWWQSKTVWGGVIAISAGIAGLFGVHLSIADQASLTESLVSVSSAVGGLIAVYGRYTATKQINK